MWLTSGVQTSRARLQIRTYRATGIMRLQVERSDNVNSDNAFDWSTRWETLNHLWRKRSSWIIRQGIQKEVPL